MAGETLSLRGSEYLGDLPTLVADELELFERTGAALDVSYGLSGKDNLAALRAGEIDFALMSVAPFVFDLLADATPHGPDDPVILANLTHGTPIKHIVSPSRELSAAGLEGSRVGLVTGTSSEYIWSLFAEFEGIGANSVELVDLGIEEIADALAAGEIDVALTWEPWTQALRRAHPEALRTVNGSAFYTARWLLVTRPEVIAAAPGVVRKTLEAYRLAIDRIQEAPDEALQIFVEKWDVPEIRVAEPETTLVFDEGLDWALFISVSQHLAWARQAGLPDAGARIRFLSTFDARPLADIAPQDVTLPARLGQGDPE